MKAVVAAFNQEKALVGAFSVIKNLRMELFEALVFSSYFSSSYFVCTVTFCEGRTVTAYRAKNMQNVGQREKGNNHGIIHIHIFQNFSKIFTSAKKWLQR